MITAYAMKVYVYTSYNQKLIGEPNDVYVPIILCQYEKIQGGFISGSHLQGQFPTTNYPMGIKKNNPWHLV